MRRTFTALAAAAAILCAATPATSAEFYKGVWEASVMGGSSSGDDNLEVDTGTTFGVRGGYSLSSKIMLELMVEYFDTEQEVSGFAGPPNDPASQVEFFIPADSSFLYYSIGLTANFRSETEGARVIPYLTVGLGAATQERDEYKGCVQIASIAFDLNNPNNEVTCDDLDLETEQPKDPTVAVNPNDFDFPEDGERSDTGTLLTAGLGVRWFVTPRFGLRGEIRYYHHDTFDQNQDAWPAVDLGVTFLLGGQN